MNPITAQRMVDIHSSATKGAAEADACENREGDQDGESQAKANDDLRRIRLVPYLL
jgi:hypothetical protein